MSPADLHLNATAADSRAVGQESPAEAFIPASAAASRRLRLKRIAVPLLLAATAAGWAAWTGRLTTAEPVQDIQLFTVVPRSFSVTLEEKGDLDAANSIDVRCELEGRSTIIYLIEEGRSVRKGDLLVELASDQIDEQIRDAEIKVASARAAYEAAVKERDILRDENASKVRKARLALQLAEMALEKYNQGERVELEQQARLDLERAESVLKRAEQTLIDSEELFRRGFITRIQRDDDEFARYEARLQHEKARLAAEVLARYTIPMALAEKTSEVEEARKELERTIKSAEASEARAEAEVAARKSELELYEGKLAKARDQKAKSRITAPADGLVVYARESGWWRTETQIAKGSQVHEQQSIIRLPDTSRMKVVIRVPEARTEHLRVGLPATVEIEGITGRRFTGQVSRIAVMADSQNRYLNPNIKEYQTEVLLDGTFTDLKPNTTARVEILIAELRDVLAVPVQAVFAKGGRYYVFVQEGRQVRPVEVRPGLAGSEYVEIRSGLEAGARVRLAVTDEMRLMLPESDRSESPDRPPAPRRGTETAAAAA